MWYFKKNAITDKNKIQTGQIINIKGVGNAQSKAINPKVIYPSILFHIVQKGDSLSTISKRYSVSIENIKAINSLSGDKVTLNQKLFIKQSDIAKDKERQLANFIVLITILDASSRTKRPVNTATGSGTKQFYISFSGQLAAGLGIGGSVQVGTATDKRGNVGIFVTVNGQAVAAGTPGFAVDGGVTHTDAKDITELRGQGYSTGAQLHMLVGGSASVGTAETKDVDTGEMKKVTSVSTEFGGGISSNAGFGTGYTFIIPLFNHLDK